MATVTFLWHLHQPAYRTADGTAHAPWVAVHAGGAYVTLARSLLESGARGHVVNLVPTLVEQMEAYRDGRVEDPVLSALCTPVAELTDEQRLTLLEWCFHVTPRQMQRFPRLAGLASRAAAAPAAPSRTALFGAADLRDLQVLFILAQAGEQAWRDPELEPLASRGGQFTNADHATAVQWLRAQPARVLDLWTGLAGTEGIEIATSPYAHPIMPLIMDTAIVAESWAPHPAPEAPAFRHPGDARLQLRRGLEFMRRRGFSPVGCWPPEGSVSEEAVALYGEAGVRWLVTDEGILARSLGRSLREGGRLPTEIHGPWRLRGDGPLLFFRDRELSDRIGFVYGRWNDEEAAAGDLVAALESVARSLPEEASIVLALDGENPWLHYPQGGGPFLRALAGRIDASPVLAPATLAELVEGADPAPLPRLHPGSWIGGTFATWIGHPEKSRAWEVLAAVRDALPREQEIPLPMLLAEGSDWFWWLGDDNPSALAPLYDRIFRRHLADACEAAGVPVPASVSRPLKVPTMEVRVPVSRRWPAPTLDGRITSYFEWSLAAWVEGGPHGTLRRLGLWSDGERLYVVVEGDGPLAPEVATRPLSVQMELPSGRRTGVTVREGSHRGPGGRYAVERVAELALPWDGADGTRLHVQLGEETLPDEAVLLLHPFPVDEEATDT